MVTSKSAPTFVTYEVNQTFVSPLYSALCGFEVEITQTGTLKGTVFYDPAGTTIIKEIDTQPGFAVKAAHPPAASRSPSRFPRCSASTIPTERRPAAQRS